MKRTFYLFCLAGTLLSACGNHPSHQELAQAYLDNAYKSASAGQFGNARAITDSIHALYPEQVSVRRLAKRLCDSIGYIEACRTAAYSDSMRQVLLPQADLLLKQFRYEKNDKYEQNGKYVHRLLSTGQNTSRCYLQCYVSDQRVTHIKSYYYGQNAIRQEAVELSANGMEIRCAGNNHSFESEGWHEIMTIGEEESLQLLNFVSAHRQERIRVRLSGKTPYVYYLQDNEKAALEDTYRLSLLMRDIRRIEENIQQAERQIGKWEAESKKNML